MSQPDKKPFTLIDIMLGLENSGIAFCVKDPRDYMFLVRLIMKMNQSRFEVNPIDIHNSEAMAMAGLESKQGLAKLRDRLEKLRVQKRKVFHYSKGDKWTRRSGRYKLNLRLLQFYARPWSQSQSADAGSWAAPVDQVVDQDSDAKSLSTRELSQSQSGSTESWAAPVDQDDKRDDEKDGSWATGVDQVVAQDRRSWAAPVDHSKKEEEETPSDQDTVNVVTNSKEVATPDSEEGGEIFPDSEEEPKIPEQLMADVRALQDLIVDLYPHLQKPKELDCYQALKRNGMDTYDRASKYAPVALEHDTSKSALNSLVACARRMKAGAYKEIRLTGKTKAKVDEVRSRLAEQVIERNKMLAMPAEKFRKPHLGVFADQDAVKEFHITMINEQIERLEEFLTNAGVEPTPF